MGDKGIWFLGATQSWAGRLNKEWFGVVFSVNHNADDVDAADVASVVFELVDHAIDALDLVALVHGPRRRSAG